MVSLYLCVGESVRKANQVQPHMRCFASDGNTKDRRKQTCCHWCCSEGIHSTLLFRMGGGSFQVLFESKSAWLSLVFHAWTQQVTCRFDFTLTSFLTFHWQYLLLLMKCSTSNIEAIVYVTQPTSLYRLSSRITVSVVHSRHARAPPMLSHFSLMVGNNRILYDSHSSQFRCNRKLCCDFTEFLTSIRVSSILRWHCHTCRRASIWTNIPENFLMLCLHCQWDDGNLMVFKGSPNKPWRCNLGVWIQWSDRRLLYLDVGQLESHYIPRSTSRCTLPCSWRLRWAGKAVVVAR
jgi:hypothetical protein